MATAAFPIGTPAAPATRARPDRIAVWLFAVAALVFTMIVVGGITRLTESGLSIVRWDPVGGIVPPLSAADWAREYAAYRTSPQGVLVNAGMSMAAFKGIFFWEYLHRVIARLFVTVLVVPLAWFALRRQVPAGYGRRLALLFGLGALEPIVGWWMVASGLDKLPSVAPERLATHLVIALSILSVALWTALDMVALRAPSARGATPGAALHDAALHTGFTPRSVAGSVTVAPRWQSRSGVRPTRWIVLFFALLTVQIVWGALTAGLRAGHAASTWPLMGDRLIPALGSIVSDPVSVQFVHRSLAYVVAITALSVAVMTYRAGAGRRSIALAGLVLAQFTLGVWTVMGGVPIPVAATHQATAALLLAASLWTAHWGMARER